LPTEWVCMLLGRPRLPSVELKDCGRSIPLRREPGLQAHGENRRRGMSPVGVRVRRQSCDRGCAEAGTGTGVPHGALAVGHITLFAAAEPGAPPRCAHRYTLRVAMLDCSIGVQSGCVAVRPGAGAGVLARPAARSGGHRCAATRNRRSPMHMSKCERAASRARAELSVREAAVRVHAQYVDAWPQRRRARATLRKHIIESNIVGTFMGRSVFWRPPPTCEGGAGHCEGHGARVASLEVRAGDAGLAYGSKRRYFAALVQSLTAPTTGN
jgi:hypothetical protein